MLNAVAFSLFIVFLFTQDLTIHIDYLSEIYNRRYLEIELAKRIDHVNSNKSFSAIMADLVDFKKINDTYGHITGDEVIKKTAQLLKSCIHKKGLVSRYGGDEFFILLDSDKEDELNHIVGSISEALKQYNEHSCQPYHLKLSMGYAVYDYGLKMNASNYETHLDSLMYQSKILIKNKRVQP